MTQVIPVRTLTILLVKEGVAEGYILDPDAAAQCLPTPIGLGTRQVETLFTKQTPGNPFEPAKQSFGDLCTKTPAFFELRAVWAQNRPRHQLI
jgi:hypothetical protein